MLVKLVRASGWEEERRHTLCARWVSCRKAQSGHVKGGDSEWVGLRRERDQQAVNTTLPA